MSDPNAKEGKWLLECNSNAWVSEELVERWSKHIQSKYFVYDYLHTDEMEYLILDKTTSHITDKIINTYIILIAFYLLFQQV